MNGLETAIRNALERSDRANAETRARVYQSARHALESGLQKQNINDPEIVTQQRHRLEAMIHAIELEERSRLHAVEPEKRPSEASAPPPVPPVRTQPVAAPETAPSVEPVMRADAGEVSPARRDFGDLRAERRDSPAEAPATGPDVKIAGDEGPGMDVRPETAIRHRKKRGNLFSRLFVFSVLLAAVGMGGWWVYTSGLLLTEAERDTSVPNPPPRAEEEDFSGTQEPKTLDTQAAFSDDWIEIFEPKRIDAIRPRGNAAVDVVSASDGTAMNIVSKSADADGNVEIAVPVDVLQQMAGRTSTISLTLQASGDASAQIAVECDFDRMGSCARHRFTVGTEKTDVLFRVSFDRAIAPASPGHLLLNSDLSGDGQSVNLYSVRILPGQ
ncbi:MAG: hypothetical protein ACYC10_04745 [Allorhizobium sp.]